MRARGALAIALVSVLATCGRGDRGGSHGGGDLPGAEPLPARVRAEIAAALARLPAGYRPRTRHLLPGGAPRYTNRLILTNSPYLRQHAHNPVNWYAWGSEAFEAARRLGRPIFLSIGYSTCHWCHVMEEESFEDDEIARTLNERYIAIKVDREERPDIDSIYMAAAQAMGVDGGWPLNLWLTPEREPFLAGTYFPPRDGERGARQGLLTILVEVSNAYRARPGDAAATGARVVEALSRAARTPGGDRVPDGAPLARAAELYASRFDPAYGGLRGGPASSTKFPSALPIRFLLREHRRSGDPRLLEMAVLTLDKMAAGGLRDHLGGGFHRYSTDRRWLVPHFEKMLYDNALLAVAYIEGYQATADPKLAEIARQTLAWAVGEMTSPEGAFYSATDADSLGDGGQREEGRFFTWTPEEIAAVLDPAAARLWSRYYDVTPSGNFEGRSIPNTPRTLDEVSEALGISVDQARADLEAASDKLRAARSHRPAPLRDEKILAAWNGLMISALARAARAFPAEPGGIDHAAHARRAARFVLDRMRAGGRLLRSYADGRAELTAYLEDYAFVTAGLLDLFEATGEREWLDDAIALDSVLGEHYEDPAGAFFSTSNDHEQLLAREKPLLDSALPSGNSVAVMNLLRLYELTTRPAYLERADRALIAVAGGLRESPTAYAEMLLALDFRLDAVEQIAIVTPGSSAQPIRGPGDARDQAAPLLGELARAFVPNHVLAVAPEGPQMAELVARIPFLDGKTALDGKPTAYVCRRETCKLPTTDPAVFAKQLTER